MKIEPATRQDVFDVALNMRNRDFDEFSAVSFCETRAELAASLSERYGDRGDVMCGWFDGVPTCIGGTVEGRPNVVTLLFFATDEFPKIALPITRWITKQLFPRLRQSGVHRIEAVSLDGYEQTHDWLRTLGLSPEAGPMHGYGKAGEAYVQFAWSETCSRG